ncbi:MAG: hypothetical protein AB1352_00895 [Patescibacteria group bacterium]
MSSRIRLLLIFSGILLLAAFAYFFALRRTRAPLSTDTKTLIESVQQQPAAATPPQPTAPPQNQPRANPATPKASLPLDPQAQLHSDLTQLALVFAERWGSYSNQQDVFHAQTIIPFMTKGMQAFALTQERAQGVTGADRTLYLGVRTKALSVKEHEFNPNQDLATFIVNTQRVESHGLGGNMRVWYQELEVRMAKEEGMWKVSGAYWRPEKAEP